MFSFFSTKHGYVSTAPTFSTDTKRSKTYSIHLRLVSSGVTNNIMSQNYLKSVDHKM